jgi:phospholipid/cholesterol/gamma-HCH transport system permease protein
MREWAEFTVEQDEAGAVTLALLGSMRVHSIGDLDIRLDAIEGKVSTLDLSRVSEIDTSGAWLVRRLAEDLGALITGESEQARRLIKAVSQLMDDDTEPVDRPGLIPRTVAKIGEMVIEFGQGVVRAIGFLGELLIALGGTIRHPGRLRVKALVYQMQLVGIDSLIIIGLMSFLVGIVIAQQGALQLREFGAEIYTIDLTGRLSMRELGVLMTAIMVAGRSGSSFAAQIGTMKLTEEIDAMRTIGVAPMEVLVIPRVLAAVFMMILLGFYASLVAIVGGAVLASIQLGIPFMIFLQRIQEVVPIYDMWVGLIKAPVFGLIIAVAGCYHGMQVKSNSEEVGRRTTQAVVTAIFAVIVLDAFFAIFFTEVGWG